MSILVEAKYQIRKNVFARCFVNIQDANDDGYTMYIGTKKPDGMAVPVGTRIFFDKGDLSKIPKMVVPAAHGSICDSFVTVKKVEPQGKKNLLCCTTAIQDDVPERRAERRVPTNFQIWHDPLELEFTVINASTKGFCLWQENPRYAMMQLALGKTYPFRVMHKGNPYTLNASIRHIAYDWRKHEHTVGVQLETLDEEQLTIVNLLIDPNFTVEIQEAKTVDSDSGKISQ